jgi:hypothetical protein
MEVTCEVEETMLEGQHGRTYPGIVVTCEQCGFEVESLGTGAGSIRRCLELMKRQCPLKESNEYVTSDER